MLHATWNAWVKSRPDPYGAMVVVSIGAAWPCLLLLAWHGLPEEIPWAWMALTIFLSIPAQALLGSAYREGDFVVAYPLVRGLNPVVIALGSAALFAERLALPKAAGVVCVSAGIALLGWQAMRRSGTVTLKGLGFAALSALATASATLADSAGARVANDPLAYAPLISIANAVAMAVYQMRRIDLRRVFSENRSLAILGPVVSTASYVITIWSIARAPVALVISLRETSILFAVFLGAVFLRERVGPWHAAAVVVVFAGVALIRA